MGIYVDLGRCYRSLDDHIKAEEALQKALQSNPYAPLANFEMALVCQESGKYEKALLHLNRTLTTWENADPDFEPVIAAREKHAEWEQN